MKNTKRLLTWILVAVLVVSTVALVACVDKPQTVELTELTLPEMKDNQMAVIIKNRNNTYTAHIVTLGGSGTDATSVEGVISYLVQQDMLTVDWTDSDTGKWLNDIGGLQPNADAHEYVAVYTSVEKDQGVGASATAYLIGDVTVGYSQYGVSGMSVENGAIIYFEIQTW